MLGEMKRELSFHNNIQFIYKDANSNSATQVAQINELAKQVGYHYPAQFRRNFQKQYKMSPAAYIEKVKSAISINTRRR